MNDNRKQMHIISWNAQSIKAHSHQLKLFINSAQIKPHIICIQESWLKEQTNFTIPGYITEKKCREGGRGGVATSVKEGVAYSRCTEVEREEVEAVVTQIHTDHGDPINIVNIYIPPSVKITNNDLHTIFQLNNVIICGDINAKNKQWGSPQNDVRGKMIQELLEEHDLVVLNTGEGTRLKNDGTYSHLDVGLASINLSTKCNWYRIDDDEWGSDHIPTMIKINEAPQEEEGQAKKSVVLWLTISPPR